MTYDEIVERLGGVDRNGMARCPAHEDRTASLKVTEADDGDTLLHCHAGCSVDTVCAAGGFKPSDLFASPTRTQHPDRPRRIVATYPYTDEAGALLFEAVRYDPKGFRQRRPDGRGGHVWDLNGTRRVLYRLPELIAAGVDTPVHIAEGEKDCDALIAAGHVATTNPAGAANWDKVTDRLDYFRDRRTIVWADRDVAGIERARAIAGELIGVARTVAVVAAGIGKDPADHLAARGQITFGRGEPTDVEVIATTTGRGPDLAAWLVTASEPETVGATLDSEEAFIVATEVRSELQRWAWEHRIPLGEVTVVGGMEKRGKSTACVWVAARLTRGQLAGHLHGKPMAVVYVSGEDHAGRVLKPRLQAVGADMSRVYFLDPTGPGFSARAVAGLHARDPIGLVVLDPLSLFVDVSAAHENGEVATRKALAPLVVLAQNELIAVVGIRHLRKDPSGPNPFDAIIGSRGYTAAARSVLFVTSDPEHPDRAGGLIFARGNLAGATGGLRYRLDVVEVELDDGNVGEHPTFVVEETESKARLEDVLVDRGDQGSEARTETEQAMAWLTEILTDQPPADSHDIKAMARREQFSEKVLRLARVKLGIVVDRTGFGSDQQSFWSLPPEPESPTRALETHSCPSPGEGTDGHLRARVESGARVESEPDPTDALDPSQGISEIAGGPTADGEPTRALSEPKGTSRADGSPNGPSADDWGEF